MNARGPACEHFANQLQEECNQIWWNGRHLCETTSMTGQPCVYPVRLSFYYRAKQTCHVNIYSKSVLSRQMNLQSWE